MRARILLLLTLCVPAFTALAEEPPAAVVTVVLKDGTTLVGRVSDEDATHLSVTTLEGLSVRVPRAAIVSMRETAPARPGAFERPDPNYSRLMFAPTARPLRKGEGYFSDHYVLFPGVAYGLTDQLSLSGGVSVIPATGLSDQVFYVSPKLGFQVRHNLAVALGAAYAGNGEGDGVAIGFGLATLGRPEKSVSAGIGFAGSRDTEYDFRRNTSRELWKWRDKPILMLGGSAQLSNNIALVSENWLLLGEKLSDQPFGLAMRFFGDRLSADVGMILVGEVIEEGFPVPWLSVSYHFGRAKGHTGAASRGRLPLRSPL
jgi:hypothetical protein